MMQRAEADRTSPYAESITVPDSDGAWRWETTLSWYCTSCSKELGADLGDRMGEVGVCRFCGSTDVSYEYWSDEPENRLPEEPDPMVTAMSLGDQAMKVFGDVVSDLWVLRAEHKLHAVVISGGTIIPASSVLIGAKYDALLGMTALAYRKIVAAYTHRGDAIPVAFVIHWSHTPHAVEIIDHSDITPESLLSLIPEAPQ